MWNRCHVFNIYADNHQEHSSGQKGVTEMELESVSGIYSVLRKQHMLSFVVVVGSIQDSSRINVSMVGNAEKSRNRIF